MGPPGRLFRAGQGENPVFHAGGDHLRAGELRHRPRRLSRIVRPLKSVQKRRILAGEGRAAERWVVKLDFVGAGRDVKPAGDGETGAVISYFKGKREDWRAGLPPYSKIIYRSLWPGIDLVYSGSSDRLKYEFIVQPGADPAKIRLAYRGADRVAVDEEGRLEVATPVGSYRDATPAAWQEMGAETRPVSLAYDLEGSSYGFRVGEYDHTLPLILDPMIMVYCGYLGGSATDYGWGIATDGAGNAYVTGYTVSSEAAPSPRSLVRTSPSTAGQRTPMWPRSTLRGRRSFYCGFIGGSGDDKGCAIAADAAGNAYVGGSTASAEASFPVLGGPDLFYGGGTYDGFVAKVNAAGSARPIAPISAARPTMCATASPSTASGNAYIPAPRARPRRPFREITGRT